MKVCCAVVVFFVRSIVVLRYFVFSMSTDDVKREYFGSLPSGVVFYASITAVTYVRYMYFMSPFSVYAYAIGPL